MSQKEERNPDQSHEDSAQPRHLPRLIVKLRDWLHVPVLARAIPLADLRLDGPKPIDPDELSKAIAEAQERLGALQVRSLYEFEAVDLPALVHRAAELDPSYLPPRFENFLALEAAPGFSISIADFEHFKGGLPILPVWRLIVEAAYVPARGGPPTVNWSNDRIRDGGSGPLTPKSLAEGGQQYLAAAPAGIDALSAWIHAGAGGEKQSLIDLEEGWGFGHEDLKDHFVAGSLLYGENVDAEKERKHGTNSLGVTCARDNALGIIGVAPWTEWVRCISYRHTTDPTVTIERAIIRAAKELSQRHFGGVLLLEVQLEGGDPDEMPVETEIAHFQAIRLAAALGVIVIEAAGNGGQDLDLYIDPAYGKIFDRSVRDSKAILVGSVKHETTDRQPIGNTGERIDCHAWGEKVDTCQTHSLGLPGSYSTDQYANQFAGTSAASSIIAGAALVVQGIAYDSLGFRFGPVPLRSLLGDLATGTPSKGNATKVVGVMPDLAAVLSSTKFNQTPDVYARDFVGDTGDSGPGSMSRSPDIILSDRIVPDPQSLWGEGSGTEDRSDLGVTAQLGRDHFLYVRSRNRAANPAMDVTARVYWSEPATLPHAVWTEIGTTPATTVPTGDQLTVLQPVLWSAAELPASGHYCFVCLLGSPEDPAPEPVDFEDWATFVTFVRSNNNVAWRNFNVLDVPAGTGTGAGAEGTPAVELDFLAPGAPDRDLFMHLESIARLPRGARASLSKLGFYETEKVEQKIAVHPSGHTALPTEVFRATKGEAAYARRMRLHLRFPPGTRGSYVIAVRQIWEGTEVGRVTWRLNVGRT